MKTYFYTIARCRAINYLNKKKKTVFIEECFIHETGINQTEEQILVNEERNRINKAIKKLKSNQQKKIMYLVDIEDMSYKEAAKILDISLPQVKMTLHRARRSLKKILEKEDM